MTGKVFVDSNILMYAHDLDTGPKQYLQPDNIALFQFVGLLGALSVVYLTARA